MNDKIKEITIKIVRDKNLIPLKLQLEKMNSYAFETKGDEEVVQVKEADYVRLSKYGGFKYSISCT